LKATPLLSAVAILITIGAGIGPALADSAASIVTNSPSISVPDANQNVSGENFDFDTSGGYLSSTNQGGFGDFGQIYANYDTNGLYLGGLELDPGGINNGVVLFVGINTLPYDKLNLWNSSGAPNGLDFLHNVAFTEPMDCAILLGDEWGDGTYPSFQLESGYDFGQGLFYLDGNGFAQGTVRLAQFDGTATNAVTSTDDDSNQQTDRWEIFIPWYAVGAPAQHSVTQLHVAGVIASDGVSGNDRYLSGNVLGSPAPTTNGNYGFTFVTLSPLEIDVSSIPAVHSDLRDTDIPTALLTYPEDMDLYTQPQLMTVGGTGCPAIAEWTRSGGPDDTLVLTGVDFSSYSGDDENKDTRFLVYAQTDTNDGIFADAAIQRISGDRVAVTLDPSLPEDAMYIVWPGNANGFGEPVAINRTDAWWIGPECATRGDTVSVYGRDLTYGCDTNQAWIYIMPVTSTGVWATVGEVNPYKVDFTVPASLSNGSYEVWIHNGHGGEYGWDGPLMLTVNDGMTWTGQQFNVRDYGAVGNGIADDTAAIDAAANAAGGNPGSTVYLPSGTYMITNIFLVPSNVRWLGDGMDATRIKASTSFSNHYSFMLLTYATNAEMRDLTLDADSSEQAIDGVLYWRDASDLRFIDMRIDGRGIETYWRGFMFDVAGCRRVLFQGCEFIGGNSFQGSASQVFYDDCHWISTDDANQPIQVYGGNGISMTDCTIRNLDATDHTDGSGWGQGRWFVGQPYWGVIRNTYLGHNNSTNMGARYFFGVDNGVFNNTGEQFLWEISHVDVDGMTVTGTASSVRLNGYSGDQGDIGKEAVIVDGCGLGQHREVTSVDTNTGTITVSPPWRVVPDTTSRIHLMRVPVGVAVYGNYLDGADHVYDPDSGNYCNGVKPYDGGLDFIADRNVFHEVTSGINLLPNSTDNTQTPADSKPLYFGLYQNNRIERSREGIIMRGEEPDSCVSMLGNVLRRNHMDGILESAVLLEMYDNSATPPPYTLMNVLEHTTARHMRRGLNCSYFSGAMRDLILYKNHFDMGTPSGDDWISFASQLLAGERPVYRGNEWIGFENTYRMTPEGSLVDEPPLEIPYRVLSFEGDGRTQGELPIWNSGITGMTWAAADDAAWLSLSTNAGSAPAEGDAALVLSCDPAGLSADTIYTGTVTIASGTQTQKAIVVFTTAADDSRYPARPTSLSALPYSSNEVSLAWTDNATNETGYVIWRRTGDSAVFEDIATAGPNATNHTDMGLVPDVTYIYHVQAVNEYGSSPCSDDVDITLLSTGPQPPSAPTGLVLTVQGTGEIELSWSDTSTNELGFVIERGDGLIMAFSELVALSSNVTTYVDRDALAAATRYGYRICAYNAAGSSRWAFASATMLKGPRGVAIGNSSEGEQVVSLYAVTSQIKATRFTANYGMPMFSVLAKVKSITGRYKCAVYADADDEPGTLLSETDECVDPVEGWNSFDLHVPVRLQGGSNYWMAVWSDSADAGIYAATSGTTRAAQYAYGDWPTVFPAGSTSEVTLCLCASGLSSFTGDIHVVEGSPLIGTNASGQNKIGEAFDFTLSGGSATTTDQGGFGGFGQLYFNYDTNGLYLGGVELDQGGWGNAIVLFLGLNTLSDDKYNLWANNGQPTGVDLMHNVAFTKPMDIAILLGDEWGDGTHASFQLESYYDFGQGLFYLSANSFVPVAGSLLSQFDGTDLNPVVTKDDDLNHPTDRWEAFIPWSSLNAVDVLSVTQLCIAGVVCGETTSGNDRYLSGNVLGTPTSSTNGNYAFNFLTLDPVEISTETDRDGDGLSYTEERATGTDPDDPDTDGDGMDDRAELIAGTSALNGDLYLHLDGARPDSQSILSWDSVAGRMYSVYRTTNLFGAWPDTSVYDVLGDGTRKGYTNTGSEASQYFKISVELAP
jgi:hypothetical protein